MEQRRDHARPPTFRRRDSARLRARWGDRMTAAPRPWIAALDPYVPGRPAASDDGSLASNESALGASPAVRAAIQEAAFRVHRYPDPLADEVRTALASELGADADSILVGNGSDELIYLLVTAFAAMGGRTICADPPYRIHDIVPRTLGCQVARVPLRKWTHDLDAMARVEGELAFICNPHNPSGTVVDRTKIARFSAQSKAGLIVIDEAYIDFTDDPHATTALDLVSLGNVVVMRTFSKLHGLAGLRIGYLVGPGDVVATLRKVRPPFSVNAVAQSAALAALADHEHRARVREETLAARDATVALFESAGYETVPSQANFILVLTPDAGKLADALALRGVSVRPGPALGVADAIRVTIPSPSGLALLKQALTGISERAEAAGVPSDPNRGAGPSSL
jgi:histidinol-phosphate aminotransferase